MKRMMAVGLLLWILCLAGCGECEHQWLDATCEAARTCSLCGAVEGAALGHTWQDADCEHTKTCTVCAKTEGTALGHTWQDATCETVKKCTTCGVEEGQPLGHTMTEANYHAPATCSVCGHTEGEVLPAAYGSYPVTVIQAQIGVEYDYKTACYVNGYTTVGKLSWENYQVFDGDETHEAVEGYQWHRVFVKIVFSDANAQKYGFKVQAALDDYFVRLEAGGNGYDDAFAVSYLGTVYDRCLMANSQGAVSEWENNACTYTAEFAWRVPVGYDGFLILFANASMDLDEGLQNGDEEIMVFRFCE